MDIENLSAEQIAAAFPGQTATPWGAPPETLSVEDAAALLASD